MLNKILLSTVAVAILALMTPSNVNAYGAAHVGYTHVGPNGVYHAGATATNTRYGTASYGHTTAAYGTNGVHTAATVNTTSSGAYHYTPSYSTGSAHYGYVR